jgi:hypothetical protein
MTTRTRKRTPKRKRNTSRNRKQHAENIRMPGRVTFLMLLGFCVGIFYLWVCSRNEALAREIKQEEARLEQLGQQVSSAGARWSEMTGLRQLQQALARHQIQMDWPRANQIIQIRDMALWEENDGQLQVVGRLDDPRGELRIP